MGVSDLHFACLNSPRPRRNVVDALENLITEFLFQNGQLLFLTTVRRPVRRNILFNFCTTVTVRRTQLIICAIGRHEKGKIKI